jgi:hypothetical protein
MTKEELFDFIHDHLKIRIEDASEGTTCGGECEGNLGVKVTLLLINPLTKEEEVISSDECVIS